MKQLFIDKKRVIMGDDTYFPFTHLISDLENIDIIGLPSTKAVVIPRCVTNDEIFGHIADITRINFGTSDNKIGVSFNQIKQCEYALFDESVLISKGLILIDNITDTSYEITLYDYIIKKLEELEGDEETGQYFLNDLTLSKNSNPLSFKSNAANTKNIIENLNQPVIPVACIRDNNNDLDKKKIRCNTVNGSVTKIDTVDLPVECSSLQLKTLKSYEFNYATRLATTIEAINDKYGDIITIDPSVQSIFNDTYMLLNNPKNEEKVVTNIHNLQSHTGTLPTVSYRVSTTGGTDVCNVNGNKVFNMNIEIIWQGDTTSLIGGRKQDGFGTWNPEYHFETTPDGTIFSKIWIKVGLSNNTKKSNPAYYEVDLIKGVNTTFYDVEVIEGTYVKGVILNTNLTFNLDFYPEFDSSLNNPTFMDLGIYNYDPGNPSYKWMIMDGMEDVIITNFSIKTGSTLTESALEFRSNDLVTTKKIMPKISIKNFIIQTVKFFNLDISLSNGKLLIGKKKYYVTNENLIIDNIDGISTNNITFSRLRLINSLPKSDILDAYKTKYKTTYGSKTINTGYSIKKSIKDITLEVSIPFLLRDYNSFAYHIFGAYMQGGYSRNTYGVIDELEGKLTFCYVKKVSETLYVTDDTPFEGGMNYLGITSTEQKFLHYNPNLTVNTALRDSDTNKFLFKNMADESYGFSTLSHYYSVTPYYFEDGVITKSLELERPYINYANILDSEYPESSTLYYRYHRNMLIDKYNSNTHILSVSMYINGLLDIYKIYNYHNSYYIISEITEYDPTKPGIYEIKLMRVNDPNNYINNIIL